MHNTVETMEDEGFDKLIMDRTQKSVDLIDGMNTMKLMYVAGDTRMANYIYEMVGQNC